ncbi:unnamed protein product [Merluccius merluccius]
MEPNVFCYAVVLFAGMASSLEITSKGPGSIVVASGQTVKLECHFTLAPEDFGPLDIEWKLLASDNQNQDEVVIQYYGDRAYDDYPFMKGRVHFNMADPKNGDASINVTGLRLSDTGTYQCRVTKAAVVRSRKILLNVMVKPSRPRCYAEGPTEQGKDVVLRCVCEEGTIPLRYTWEKISDSKLLPASAVLDAVGGTMNVRNASTSVSGTYRCKATNRVGNEECILHVDITPSPNTASIIIIIIIIAGAIIAVLLILIIAIILFCCCRARQRKKYEREDMSLPWSHVQMGSMTPSNLHEDPLVSGDFVWLGGRHLRPAAQPHTPGPASHTPWPRQPHTPGSASHTPLAPPPTPTGSASDNPLDPPATPPWPRPSCPPQLQHPGWPGPNLMGGIPV